MELLLWSVH